MMSRDDEQEFKSEARKQNAKASSSKSFQWEWKEAFQEARTRKCKSDAARDKKLRAEVRRYKGPGLVPPGAITQPEAKAMVPPGASIWRDLCRGGWCGHMQGFRRCSRPWSTEGHREACMFVLRTLWNQFLLSQGLDASSCPIRGLFSESGPSSSSRSGGAAAAASNSA